MSLVQDRAVRGVPVLASHDAAVTAAHELGRLWRVRGPARDRDRTVPRAELEALSRSGLLSLTVPVRFGGPGAGAETLTEVFAILAAADLALAQVPQNHFGACFGLEIEDDEERQAFFYGQVLRGARFGNAGNERGKGSRGLPKTTLTDDGDGFLLNGTKHFCTGALTADWVPVSASHPDGWVGTAFVPQGTPGMVINEDWDAFGQRATVSGATTLTNARVAARHVFNHAGRPKPATAFRYSRSQLTHAALQLGLAREMLALSYEVGPDAPDHRLRSWRDEVTLDIEAATVLITRAADLIDEVVAGGTVAARAALAVGIAVDEAKCVAYDLGPTAADGLAEFVTAEQAADGFDRFWRNARTHSLHDPIRWRRHYVGNHHLNGTPPPFLKWLLDSPSDAPL